MPHLKFEWNPAKFRILGIWFTNDLKGCAQLNLDVPGGKKLFMIWLKKVINPKGRTAILKSLILSQPVHLWLHLPDPLDTFIEGLEKERFFALYGTKTVTE